MFLVAGNVLSNRYQFCFLMTIKKYSGILVLFQLLYIDSEDGKEEEKVPSGWKLST